MFPGLINIIYENMKIAVCDDDKVFLTQLSNCLQEISKNNNWICDIDSYDKGENLIQGLKIKTYDAVFLDIDMPQLDGFTIAEQIRKKNENILIIFCTSHDELVYDSFGYQPFWFLCKQNYLDILENVLSKMRKRMTSLCRAIEFDMNHSIHRVEAKDIMYIDVSKHKIFIHMHDGTELSFRGKISDMEKSTDTFGFAKINSGTVVNLDWIGHIYTNEVILKNGIILSLSRGKGNLIKTRFNQYKSEGR